MPFACRIATFFSWNAAANHLVNINLIQSCTKSSISSLNCSHQYVSSRPTATARVCSFLWIPWQTSYANLTAFSPNGFSWSVPFLILRKDISPFYVLSKFPGHDPFRQLFLSNIDCVDEVPIQLTVVIAPFGNWIEITMWPNLGNMFQTFLRTM